jgi:hypothetical protein
MWVRMACNACMGAAVAGMALEGNQDVIIILIRCPHVNPDQRRSRCASAAIAIGPEKAALWTAGFGPPDAETCRKTGRRLKAALQVGGRADDSRCIPVCASSMFLTRSAAGPARHVATACTEGPYR